MVAVLVAGGSWRPPVWARVGAENVHASHNASMGANTPCKKHELAMSRALKEEHRRILIAQC